ncbi:CC-NBS-LRR resistance protein, partial [Trifolium pratense]
MTEFVGGGASLWSVFQVIQQRLASTVFIDYFDEELVNKLQVTLNSINEVLDDAETKQYQNLDVKNWLSDLKLVSYKVEQVLDVIAIEAQQKESFDLTRLTRSILESIDSSAVDCENYILQRELQQRLAGKRYLLVLDDVWNKDRHTWDNFILRFSGSSGCKMIVTTRNMEVASVMRSTRLLHLKQLEENDSWSLFVKYAFR